MKIVKEGSAEMALSKSVFYNPKMKRLRDISVLFLKSTKTKAMKVLDSTSATGIRGIRYALEAGLDDITLLDISKEAYRSMKANAKRNGLKIKAVNASIQEFANTCKEAFDVIDLDPFGTPVPYLHDLMKIAKDDTLLLATATDTATLCGAQANACLRLYSSKPLNNELCHEVGIRILISFIARTAAQFNFGIEPLLSLSELHYMRVFLRLRRGAKEAVESMKSLGFGSYCNSCHAFYFSKSIIPCPEGTCSYTGDKTVPFGPLWLGSLNNKKVIAKMLKKAKEESIRESMQMMYDELETPFFYSTDKITCYLGKGSVSKSRVLNELKKECEATATQFDRNGIKTAAGIGTMVDAVKRAQQQ